MTVRDGRSRPRQAASTDTYAADHSISLEGILLSVEIDARQLGRRLEHLSVTYPDYTREAGIILKVARRLRGDRLGVAA